MVDSKGPKSGTDTTPCVIEREHCEPPCALSLQVMGSPQKDSQLPPRPPPPLPFKEKTQSVIHNRLPPPFPLVCCR
jgi:hypothetical protein